MQSNTDRSTRTYKTVNRKIENGISENIIIIPIFGNFGSVALVKQDIKLVWP